MVHLPVYTPVYTPGYTILHRLSDTGYTCPAAVQDGNTLGSNPGITVGNEANRASQPPKV